MTEKGRKYTNGKIYCIRNWVDDDVYVGSTIQPLSKRMQKHRDDSRKEKQQNRKLYKKMNELGIEQFYIELLEKFECNDGEELHQQEGKWIRQIGTLNGHIAGRTRKESSAEYHQNNRESINERHRQNRINNAEQTKEGSKVAYEKHKNKIFERRKEIIECPCGVKHIRHITAQHKKTKHHQQWEVENKNISNNIYNDEIPQEKPEDGHSCSST